MTTDSGEPTDGQDGPSQSGSGQLDSGQLDSGQLDSGRHDSGRLAPEDRAKKFAENTPPIPRKAIVVAAVAFVVLGLGGALFDHFFGGPVSSTSVTAATDPPSLETTTLPHSAKTTLPTEPVVADLPGELAALMGLTKLSASPASGFTLETAGASKISLAALRGKVVVVSFFDSRCDDICPVLSNQLRQAYTDLGPDASQVEMLTVNTDPVATSVESAGVAATRTVLRSVTEWHFLTGTLAQLNTVWNAYGVSIEVQPSTNLVSHNEVLYFIDPAGRLRFRATPFANEAANGSFSLPVGIQKRFASGVADTARSLIGKNQLTAEIESRYLGPFAPVGSEM